MQKPIAKIVTALKNRQHKTMLEDFREKYTPFQILIATVMSARTKDTTTMPLANELFKRYRRPDDLLQLSEVELEKKIYPIGFYKTKARNILLLCQKLKDNFNGKVPRTMDELLTLPGVGRKTANCTLGYAFNIPCIAVDIHVHRISNRIGLVSTRTPEDTEQALLKTVPQELWLDVNDLFVTHGQTICSPRNPKCAVCPIQKWCDYGTSH
jgi:endonuclease III